MSAKIYCLTLNQRMQRKQRVSDQDINIFEKQIHGLLSKKDSSPKLLARSSWTELKKQLLYVLNLEQDDKRFDVVTPLILKDNHLILQASSDIKAQFFNTHYLELCDKLLNIQNKNFSCVFIGPDQAL